LWTFSAAGTRYHAYMFSGSFLLRVLMIVALLVNGVGNAYASTQMLDMMQSTPAADVMPDSELADAHAEVHDKTQGGCHDAMSADAAPVPLPPPHDHDGPDCCKGNTCRCLCLHAATAVALPPADLPHVLHPRLMSAWRSQSHAAPALPDLIRPPIG
jgi:hypothetical protein